MKKRILAILLVLAMVSSYLSVGAVATGEDESTPTFTYTLRVVDHHDPVKDGKMSVDVYLRTDSETAQAVNGMQLTFQPKANVTMSGATVWNSVSGTNAWDQQSTSDTLYWVEGTAEENCLTVTNEDSRVATVVFDVASKSDLGTDLEATIGAVEAPDSGLNSYAPAVTVWGEEASGQHAELAYFVEACHSDWSENWKPLSAIPVVSGSHVLSSGNYYLTSDVQLSGTRWKVETKDLDIKLCLNGHSITQTTSGQRVIKMNNGAKLTITDCKGTGVITGGKNTGGAGIWVENSSTLDISNVTISGNSADSYGGGMYIVSKSTVTMTNVTVSGNTTTGSSGGGIFIENSNVTMTDCTVTGNTTTVNGGGIELRGDSTTLTIKGDTVISGNTASGTGANMHMNSAAGMLTVADLGSNASIGVTLKDGRTGAFTNALSANYSTAFFADRAAEGYGITYKDNKLYYGLHENHCICGGTDAGHDHSETEWTLWGDDAAERTKLPTASGNYCLTADVVLSNDRWRVDNAKYDIKLCMNGHSITQTASGQRVIKVDGGAKLTITDCQGTGVITGGSATTGGGIWVDNQSGKGTAVNLSNITISGNKATDGSSGYGGGLYIAESAQATLTNVTVKDNTAACNGGGIYIATSAQLTMTGCTVTGNESSKNGGGVAISSGATVTVSGCTFQGNTAKLGAGIYQTTTEPQISYLTLKGDTNTDTATVLHDNVWVNLSDAELTVSGAVIMDEDKMITLPLGDSLNVKELDPTAAFTFTQAEVGTATVAEDPATVNGEPILTASGEMTQWPCGAVKFYNGTEAVSVAYSPKSGETTPRFWLTEDHVHIDGTVYQPYNASTTAAPTTSDNYYLTSDINLDARWNVGSGLDVKVCMNGHTVKQTASNQRVIKVSAGGKLDITDCTGTGVITGGVVPNNAGGAIWVENSSTLDISNVTISGNKVTGSGAYGGAVYIINAQADLTNVTITDNSANTGGGAIAVKGPGKLTMTGGKIYNNSAAEHGGAIYIWYEGAKAELTNVTITDNSANTSGGAIAVRESGKLTMTGGKVYQNSTPSQGGGLYAHAGTVTNITGTVFDSNSASAAAGGVGFGNSAKGTLTNVTITDNTSNAGGGLVVQGSAQVETTNCTIQDNTAPDNGGGIYLAGTSALTMNGGTVSGNQAKNNGGGIYLRDTAKLTLKNVVKVENNQLTNGTASNAQIDTITTSTKVDGVTTKTVSTRGNYLDVKGLTSGSSIGITLHNDYLSAGTGGWLYFTADIGSADVQDYFFGDDPACTVTKLTRKADITQFSQTGDADWVIVDSTERVYEAAETTRLYLASAEYNNKLYESLTAAATAAGGSAANGFVQLVNDVTATDLATDLYLDLNGNDANVANTGTLYVIDTTTDDFLSEGEYGMLTTTSRLGYTNNLYTANGKQYLQLSEGGNIYSFHRVYMSIYSKFLRTGSNGIGFKARFAADEAVSTLIGSTGADEATRYSYGIRFAIEGAQEVADIDSNAAFAAGKDSLTPNKVIIIADGVLDINGTTANPGDSAGLVLGATPYIKLTTATGDIEITGQQVGTSLNQLIQSADGQYAKLSDTIKANIQNTLNAYSSYFANAGLGLQNFNVQS